MSDPAWSLRVKLKRFRYFPEKCSLFSGYIFQHFFRNENGKSSERQWLPTLYLYITTVVINEKKRSFDVLCIDITVNVQNLSFPSIFDIKQKNWPAHNNIPERFRKKAGNFSGKKAESFKFRVWTQFPAYTYWHTEGKPQKTNINTFEPSD